MAGAIITGATITAGAIVTGVIVVSEAVGIILKEAASVGRLFQM
jgi:hypothetical protein